MKKYNALIMIGAVLLLAIIVGLSSNFRDRGENTDIFDYANFAQTRQPLNQITDSTPHGQIAVSYIKYINDNLYERFSKTVREMEAAAWIVDELLAIGYSWDNISVQEFKFEDISHVLDPYMLLNTGIFVFLDHSPFAHLGMRPALRSQNVILTVPGQSEQVIVVGAHYDSVFYPGASDNASGVALLLESSQRLLNIDNYYTIEYVFFGAEEIGLIGAYYYVNSLTPAKHNNLLFMINADILLDGEDLLYMAGYDANGRVGANYITESWDYIAQEINAHYDLNLKPLPWGVFGPSDHLAFLPHGHTAMFLAGLEIDEMPDGDITYIIMDLARVVHSPRDNIHYIMETWPGKAEENMRAFSIFLEEIILATYYLD